MKLPRLNRRAEEQAEEGDLSSKDRFVVRGEDRLDSPNYEVILILVVYLPKKIKNKKILVVFFSGSPSRCFFLRN